MHRNTWTPQQIFRTIETLGKVSREEMEKTFNMGVGMVAIVSAKDKERTLAMLTARHVDCWELGEVRSAKAGEQARAVLLGDNSKY